MCDVNRVCGYVYVNSDMAKHYPAHFSEVYSELKLIQYGLVSKKEALKRFYGFVRPRFWSRYLLNFRHVLFPFVFWYYIIFSVRNSKSTPIIIIHDSPIALLLGYVLRVFWVVPRNSIIVYRVCHLFGEDLLSRSKDWRKFMIHLWIKLRSYSLLKSDINIYMSSAMKDYLTRSSPVLFKDDLVIPSLVNLDALYRHRRRNPISSSVPRAVYIGNVDLNRDFEPFLAAFKIVNEKLAATLDIFAVFNNEIEKKRLLRVIEINGLESCVFLREPMHGSAFYSELASYDFGFSIYASHGAHFFNSPVKTVEYMALGLPWFGSDIPEHRRILSELELDSAASDVLMGDIDDLAEKMLSFIASISVNPMRQLPKNKLHFVDFSYSRDKIKSILSLY